MRYDLFYLYVKDCFEKLQESLSQYMRNGENESLFRFRVSIKKIRVCLLCIEQLKNERASAIRHKLRKYFRRFGSLRELKLYEEWFLTHRLGDLSEALNIPHTIRKKDGSLRKYDKEIIKDLLMMKKEILKDAKKISREHSFAFYVDLIEKLPLPLTRIPQNKWHGMRKMIKRVLYARHWQEGVHLRLISNSQAVHLDNLQHLIGDWHDNKMMSVWLRSQNDHKNKPAQKLPVSWKKAIFLLNKASENYVTLVVRKLGISGKILAPLKKRLARVKK